MIGLRLQAVPSKLEELRKVVRVVTQGPLIHFYLDCGHLITEHTSDHVGKFPSELRCWACAEEKKNASTPCLD